MSSTSEPVAVLSEDESWNLLSSVALGRYVTSLGSGRLEIFPVNFVVQNRTVLFRTAEGTKLFGAVAHNQVLFEADNHKVDGGWSVIVRGTARVLYGSTELDEAERAGLHPWIATEKLRFVRIRPTEITGRRFVFGLEPDRSWVHG
jgi:nitroimidazol reductase NimA-like FMN-containing flavoprotein (pyridoxamine 5'-phosphate oxidase superfamily)